MHPRTVDHTTLTGFFALPMGIRFYNRDIGPDGWPSRAEVSTVCLEGGHLEDPLRILKPEHGYETMVFLDGCTFFSAYTAKYATREEAATGHKDVVEKMLAGELPLAVPLTGYRAEIAKAAA